MVFLKKFLTNIWRRSLKIPFFTKKNTGIRRVSGTGLLLVNNDEKEETEDNANTATSSEESDFFETKTSLKISRLKDSLNLQDIMLSDHKILSNTDTNQAVNQGPAQFSLILRQIELFLKENFFFFLKKNGIFIKKKHFNIKFTIA